MGRTQDRRRETMDRSAADLTVLIRQFEVHNKTDNKSPRTIEWYNEVLGLFDGWLIAESRETTIGSIDEMVVREFILDLQERPGIKSDRMSSHSIYNRVNALRSFFRWLYEKGYTAKHVLQGLKQPKTSDILVEPLTDVEIGAIFATVNSNGAMGARNVALLSSDARHGTSPLRGGEFGGIRSAHRGPVRETHGQGDERANRLVRFGLPEGVAALRPPLPSGTRLRWDRFVLSDKRRLPNDIVGGQVAFQTACKVVRRQSSPSSSSQTHIRDNVLAERRRHLHLEAKLGTHNPVHGRKLPSHRQWYCCREKSDVLTA